MLYFVIVCCGLVGEPPADSTSRNDRSPDRAANARVRLALGCEARGLQAQRLEHLKIVVQVAPDHVVARGLLGQVADRDQWREPEEVAEQDRNDAELAALMVSYRSRREKIPDTAEAHWQLSQWCERNELNDEALAHRSAVVRINPSREEAWKALGYRKQPDGRWMTAEQAASERAETDAQRKADARWRPLLQKWKTWLGPNTRRAEAEVALAAVDDPRAVPSIWKVFAAGSPDDQERAVALLNQVDAPGASRALTSLALFGSSPQVRRKGSEALARRDPRDFAGILVELLRDPISYEIRQVLGPGMPGELYIKGEKANTRRFYSAPPPLASLRPGDLVVFDGNGLAVADRVVGYGSQPLIAALDARYWGGADLTGAGNALAQAGLGNAGQALGHQMAQNQHSARIPSGAGMAAGGSMVVPLEAQVPIGQFMLQAEQQAELARRRLQEDVAAIERYNRDVNEVNDRATLALKVAMMEDFGPDRRGWVRWWTGQGEVSSAAPARPLDSGRSQETTEKAAPARAVSPAFGAGTAVWTRSGPRPIEEIRAGDRLLTHDTSSGSLSFSPVLAIRCNAPCPVESIEVGGEPIIATDLERLWVVGKGWVMVRDLRPQDLIRVLRGAKKLDSVKSLAPRPVYHVQVAEGRGILVGRSGILVHDERPAQPVLAPFDAVILRDPYRRGHPN